MDPISAFGLAANIVAFLDFGFRVVRSASEVHRSSAGATDDVRDSGVIADSVQYFMNRLQTTSLSDSAPKEYEKLALLAKNCSEICSELQSLVGKVSIVVGEEVRQVPESVLNHIVILMSEKQIEKHAIFESLLTSRHNLAIESRDELRQIRDDILVTIRSELQRDTDYSAQEKGQTSAVPKKRNGALNLADYSRRTLLEPNSAGPTQLVRIQEELKKMSSSLRTVNAQERILELLWSREIRHRENSIEIAEEGTYLWLLNDAESGSRDSSSTRVNADIAYDYPRAMSNTAIVGLDERETIDMGHRIQNEEIGWKQKRDDFLSWLESGSGVFYISGKAGSGKSTLIKTLAQNPRTIQILSDWAEAEGKSLIFGQFFFWNPGTPLQKNIEGLYRSILWKILSACPSLIESIYPDLFRYLSNTPFQSLEMFHDRLQVSELQTALETLIKSQDLVRQYKVCLFIDGLDEFSGDYWKLAKQLKDWCMSSDLKICVSSRPYNEFQQVFKPENASWLKLHELTCQDMLCLVKAEFSKDERFTNYLFDKTDQQNLATSLIETIVSRADGVFMWVRLVMHALLTSMGNSCSVPQLLEKLAALPDGLTLMYQRMVDQIDIPDRRRVFQTILSMKNDAVNHKPSHLVYVQAIIDDMMDDPTLEKRLLDGTVGPFLSHDDCTSKCRTMSQRLNGRCQGLLEVASTGSDFPYCHEVKFVHRTVSEFVDNLTHIEEVLNVVGDFNPRRATALGLLATIKFIDPDSKISCRRQVDIVSSRLEVGHYNPAQVLHPLLELAASSELSGSKPFISELESLQNMYLGYPYEMSLPMPICPLETILGWHWEPSSQDDMDISLTIVALCHGCFGLVKARLGSNPELLRPSRHSLLLAASICEAFDPPCDIENSLTKILLAKNVLPNEPHPGACRTSIQPSDKLSFSRDTYFPDPPWTTWTLFLMCLYGQVQVYEDRLDGVFPIIDLYLRYGADPSVCFIGYHHKMESGVDDGNFSMSEDDESEMREPDLRETPDFFYANLQTTFRIWGLSVPENTQKMLCQRTSPNDGALSWLRRYIQNTPQPKRELKEIEWDGIPSLDYMFLKVGPEQDILSIRTFKAEENWRKLRLFKAHYRPVQSWENLTVYL